MSDQKRTKRRAPAGAYTITKRDNGSANGQYFTTIPTHIAAPLYEADLALTYEVVDEGILIRPVPMRSDDSVGDDAARALVDRIINNTRTDG